MTAIPERKCFFPKIRAAAQISKVFLEVTVWAWERA